MTESDRRIREQAAGRHGVFTAADAAAAGINARGRSHRIRSDQWDLLYPRVYRISGAPENPSGALLAACLAGGQLASASHRSAAALWGLAGGRTDLVEITCSRWRRTQHPGLVVHETNLIRAEDLTTVDGIPVTHPARTLFDLGAVCSPSVVEMALDATLRRQLVSYVDLEQMLRDLGRRGRNGAGVLRSILGLRDPTHRPAESEMESRLRLVLRRHGLPEPVPQHEIRVDGRFIARVDFAYPDRRIAIEYDSYEHHSGTLAHERDNARRNLVVSHHWTMIVATAADIRSGGDDLARSIYPHFGVSATRSGDAP